jgi:hypothetical protein
MTAATAASIRRGESLRSWLAASSSALVHEVGGDRGRDHPEHGDAGDHQHDRDGPAGRRHREAVAAADRGDRGHRPPQRIRVAMLASGLPRSNSNTIAAAIRFSTRTISKTQFSPPIAKDVAGLPQK